MLRSRLPTAPIAGTPTAPDAGNVRVLSGGFVPKLGFGLLVAMTLAASPTPAMACSGPPTDYHEALRRARLILLADVSTQLFGGAAYDLTIVRVYRGHATSPLRIGATTDPGIPGTCSLGFFNVGERVVVALQDARDLGPFSSAGWAILADGTLRTVGFISGSPATANELLADLARLPDTALPAPAGGGRLAGLLVAAFLVVFLLLAIVTVRARLNAM